MPNRAALMRENAKVVGTEKFANIQESQIAFFDAQLAAWRGDYKSAAALAKKNAELVANENNVSVNNFNTVDFALLRSAALRKAR